MSQPEHIPAAAGRESAPHPSAGEVVRRLGPAGILAVFSAVMPLVGSVVLFWKIQDIGEWLSLQGVAGRLAYVAAFAFLAGMALMPTYALALLGGWAFGLAAGFPAALAGFVGAAAIGHEISRRASGDRVIRLIDEQPRWRAVVDSLVHGSFGKSLAIVTLVRLPPNSPFAITNLVMASTKVGGIPYILGTLIGMAPRTALAVAIGAGIQNLTSDAVADARRRYIFWGIGAAVAVVLIIGQMAKRALERLSAPGA